MIINLGIGKKFHKASLKETLEKTANPGIGWYHLYTFDAGCADPELYIACEEEEIVLLLIDIGAFREKEISAEALLSVRQIFRFFAEHQKEMIIRFAYDTEGKGMEKEPESGELILSHIHALGQIIKEYHNHIMVMQGILVGNWGEMHGSKFLSERWMIKLVQAVLEAADYSCALAVRKPSQLRYISRQCDRRVVERLTLFNDGMFGSKTDLGTYGSGGEDRKKELTWQEEYMRDRYVGGEALAEQHPEEIHCIDGKDAFADMRQMHLSYLNSVYQKELLDHWKKEELTWQQARVSAYDYIGAHLGYRFVVCDVKWKKDVILIQIKNTGFANLCEEAVCKLVIRSENQKKEKELKTDARAWECQKEVILEVRTEKEDREKGKEYLLQLFRKKDGRTIRFANEGAEEGVLLGKF